MIAIIGNGYVAQVLKANLGHQAQIVEGRFSSLEELREVLARIKPVAVVNAAHKGTPASMESLEEYSREWNDHALVNVDLPVWIARLTGELDFHFVHISSLMVLSDWGLEDYDLHDPETRGYDEVMPNFASYPEVSNYARMKLMAEYALLANSNEVAHDSYRVLAIRIHLPFSRMDHPRNILNRYCQFKGLATDTVSMTDLDELARVIPNLVSAGRNRVLHFVNPGVISAFRVGELLYEHGLRDSAPEATTLKEINEARQGAYQPRIVAHSCHLELYGKLMEFSFRPVEEAVLFAIRRLQEAKRRA